MIEAKRWAVFSTRKNVWVRAGSARLERDGSINVELDVLPLNGKLHLRPEVEPAAAVEPPEIWAERRGHGREYSIMMRPAGAEPHQVGVVPAEVAGEVLGRLATAALHFKARLAAPPVRELPSLDVEARS